MVETLPFNIGQIIMQAIGGYFGLEPILNEKTIPFHSEGYSINFGRGGLLAILKARGYKRIWLPEYNCPSVTEYLTKHHIAWKTYPVDSNLNPILPNLIPGDAFCYINYFGIKSAICRQLEAQGLPLILDLTQAFFYKPLPQTDAFSSARKFVGVPDGGYLFGPLARACDFVQQEMTPADCQSLFLRQQGDVAGGYVAFQKQDESLINWQPAQASQMTLDMFERIDWEVVIHQRKANFRQYAEAFDAINTIALHAEEDALALCYPLQADWVSNETKQALIAKKIFVPTYWPGTIENAWTQNTLFLPCDQRYTLTEIDFVIQEVKRLCPR